MCLPLSLLYLSLSSGLSQVHRLSELHKHRRTIIGHTSEPRRQLILPTASRSLPRTPRLWKHRLTGAEPHAVFLPAHIISLYLHSSLKLLLFSSHGADNFAVIFYACGEGCCIKNIPTEPHASLCNHNKWKFKGFFWLVFQHINNVPFCFYFLHWLPPRSAPHLFNTTQRWKRCRGTTLALSCLRSPTAGRAPLTPTWSTAPSSPTSATPASNSPALRY